MLLHYLSTHKNTNTNMKKLSVIALLVLLAISQLTYSRSIKYGSDMIMVSDGVSGSGEGEPVPLLDPVPSETCEPVYGFLPCSSNAWGLLFLIVVYEILLSTGGSYVATGSDLFFQITGPGIFGASLFQILGVIPQIVLVLVSALSGSVEAAEQRATFGMGLVAGTTVMLLTLIWGISVILGSYDLSEASTSDETGSNRNAGKGDGVVTDAETSYTARLMVVSLVPFLILLLAKAFDSSSGRRVIVLVALLVAVILFLAYVLYQIFQPWVQNRRFEYLMNKYAKDKLLMLLSRNGKPDNNKIQQLFSRIDKDKSTSVSPLELRVLLLGVNMDEDDLSTERDVENILGSFDVSGDGRISQDEFIRGMTSLATDLADQTPDRIKIGGGNNSQKQLQQRLLSKTTNTIGSIKASSNSWLNYAKAFSYVILGTGMTIALSQPLVMSVTGFAQATNLSSFCVSYVAIPFALNYGVAVNTIASARQKTQKSISLALSSLYGGVYMNNVIGMISFLAPVFARHLWADAFAEVGAVLVICIVMTMLASLGTKFTRLTGYLVLLLYPISLALVYLITSVLGWT